MRNTWERATALTGAALLVAALSGAAEPAKVEAEAVAAPVTAADVRLAAKTSLKQALHGAGLASDLTEESLNLVDGFVRSYVRALASGDEITRRMTLDELMEAKLVPEFQARGLSDAAQVDALARIKGWIDSEIRFASAEPHTNTTDGGRDR